MMRDRAGAILLVLLLIGGACSSSEQSLDGEVVYANNCARCHGADLGGTPSGPALDAGSEGAAKSDAEYSEAIRSGPRSMPSFRGLSEEQVTAVIGYLRQLQSP